MRLRASQALLASVFVGLQAVPATAQTPATWTFAVSGDSRNCGDFVVPAIAAKVKAENDAFYWHLGDFRKGSNPDEDMVAVDPALKAAPASEYLGRAWDDFLTRQMVSFGDLPVFLGRGNHEVNTTWTRDAYLAKFSKFLTRPEIEAQRKADSDTATPQPYFHWTKDGVDFITLDNAAKEEFSDQQLRWLRGVLDRDLAPGSGIKTIVAAGHEALPHSTGSEHAMDDWDLGLRTGELVYTWLYDAQAAGKNVYILASHSHYFSPNIFNTGYWKQHASKVVPGYIIGLAGAQRYQLPRDAGKGAKEYIYGYLRGTVHADGAIDFALQEISEAEMMQAKWPNGPQEAVHDCYVHNTDRPEDKKPSAK